MVELGGEHPSERRQSAPDAKAYPNNAGFAQALLHIRDKYAPNAVLALHSSAWGSTIDV
jgi:hypothetical protein